MTDTERRALTAASCGNCGERTAVLNLVERIVAAHVTDVLRRVADQWQAQREAATTDSSSSWSRGYWKGVETAIAELHAEADRIKEDM